MQEEGVSADAVMSQMPAKIPRPQLKGLTPINIEYWLDDNILPLVNFYSDKSSWVKKYVRFNFLPDDQFQALKRWTQGALRRELLSVLEETWAMIQDELKEHVTAFKKLSLSPARNYHSIMSEGNTILELIALEHKFRVSSQDVLGEEADERFAEVRKLVDRTYANCDEVMPKTLLTPRAKEAGKK